MSEPAPREFDFALLVSGVAAALRYMTTAVHAQPSQCILSDPVLDERREPLGEDPLEFFSDSSAQFKTAPTVAFRSIVFDLSVGFDLTPAELITAYFHFEHVIRRMGVKAVPFYVMRPLFASCVALAVKTLDDSAITIVEISEVLTEMGYRASPSRVAHMERALLDALEFDINSCTVPTYWIYADALVNEGVALQPRTHSEAG